MLTSSVNSLNNTECSYILVEDGHNIDHDVGYYFDDIIVWQNPRYRISDTLDTKYSLSETR